MTSDFLFSLITAVVAAIALLLTLAQIRISNKQHLFDKRVENYLLANGLVELLLENKQWFDEKKKDEPELAIDVKFRFMTNNAYLESIAIVMKKPLENPAQKEFLTKLEEIKELASKIKFLFPAKSAEPLSQFILDYQKLLHEMYKYRIIIMRMTGKKYRPLDIKEADWTIEKASASVSEPYHRKELYRYMDTLVKSYDTIEKQNVLSVLEKKIKL